MDAAEIRRRVLDQLRIGEDADYEFKAAQGRDGKGELPSSYWQTYSAMANTEGGYIVLGIREEREAFEVVGLANPSKVRKELWDGANNREVVSSCLLKEAGVQVLGCDGRDVLWTWVPRGKRTERPVFVGSDLFSGTYKRNFSGDYRCDSTAIRRMLADAQEESRDARLLPHMGLADLDSGTLERYRSDFKTAHPGHPWTKLGTEEMLRSLGGWRRDRETTEEGPTLAGLLAFGRHESIMEEVPTYLVDYQERGAGGTVESIVKRITPDGLWSGNLYDFYLRVSLELLANLRVPYSSIGGAGTGDLHVRRALREALVNALIHADYSGTIGILVTKQEGSFTFRNPGGLRLPLSDVLDGGNSDCRNRGLQTIFQMVGAAEKAGSGIPKIMSAWFEQGWRTPLLRERVSPEMTLLQLPLTSLIPPEVAAELSSIFLERFTSLGPVERSVLATARIEGTVSNARVRELDRSLHGMDATLLLRRLVHAGLLLPQGVGRGSAYSLNMPAQGGPTKSSP